MAPSIPPPTAKPALAAAPVRTPPARVLLVDDSPSIRALLRVYLAARRFDFVEAAGPAEALEVLKREPVDLVITDLNMGPGMDGVGLALELRASFQSRLRAVPVVLLTTEADLEAVKRRGAEARITAYVHKPISCPALLSLVDGALAQQRAA